MSGKSGVPVPSDIEIARAAQIRPIEEIGDKAGIPGEHLFPYGRDKAKIGLEYFNSLGDRPDGKLILVTGITPTPAGEGKTTTSVGLGDGLSRIGKQAILCLREPSLGPCFGMKGGAAGGGYAQVVPMESINLHFTGDFHAISAAHNLLAAMVDNHIHWGNALGIDVRRAAWGRVVDMNDRALRKLSIALGGIGNGYPRESGFDITVASEVMAIFCLAEGLADLERRLGNIVIGQTRQRESRYSRDLQADGAMTVLLKDALMPNLGPDSGGHSRVDPRRALRQYRARLQFGHGNPAWPQARRLHSHRSRVRSGSGSREILQYQVPEGGPEAGRGGGGGNHPRPQNARRRGARRPWRRECRSGPRGPGQSWPPSRQYRPLRRAGRWLASTASLPIPMPNSLPFATTARVAALPPSNAPTGRTAAAEAKIWPGKWWKRRIAAPPTSSPSIRTRWGFGKRSRPWPGISTAPRKYRPAPAFWPKSPSSRRTAWAATRFAWRKPNTASSTDPNAKGAPSGHSIHVREVRLSCGAEFVVAICGDMLTMPGLPRVPAAESIRLNQAGRVEGLF